MRLPVWVLSIVGLIVASANAVQTVYATPHDRDLYANSVGESTGAIAMAGPPIALHTLAGITVFETSATALVSIALMAIFLTVRHTRAEEEAGRTELLRAGRLGRLAPVAATGIAVGGGSVVVGAAIALSLVGLGLPTSGSWLFGASIACFGLVMTGVALLCAQIFEHARTAIGTGSAILGAAFTIRAVGDVSTSALSWLSPMGWSQATHPYEANRWWPLVLPVVATAALVVASAALVERRDMGAGLVAPRLGPPSAPPRLASSWGLALRLQRTSALWWAFGLFVGGIAFGSVAGSVDDLIGDRQDLKDALVPEGGDIVDGYLTTSLLILALVAGGFTVSSVLRLRSEETSGRAEPLLATGLSRLRWATGTLVFTAVGTVAVLAAGGVGLGLTGAIVTRDAGLFGRTVAGAVIYVPAALVLAAFAVLLEGWLPQATPVAWAVLAGCFVIGYLGQLLEFPQWLTNASPYTHVPKVLIDGFTAAAPLVLLLIAALLGASGIGGLLRRDLG
ncbi:MAG TPA: hypothetical protein VH419_08330 [Nocardioidaceae bacterium]